MTIKSMNMIRASTAVLLAVSATLADNRAGSAVLKPCNGKRRIYVEANVTGRDLGGFVDDARGRITDQVEPTSGGSRGADSSRTCKALVREEQA